MKTINNFSSKASVPAKVLYISYTGLLDPLGQSQVMQYVIELSQTHKISLISYEKPFVAVGDSKRLEVLEAELESAGVTWVKLRYHNRFGIASTVFDIVVGTIRSLSLARKADVEVVHTRSYIAGILGVVVKRCINAKFVFDMRGFWPDERVDGGIWKKRWLRYRFFKKVEKMLFTYADHVVSLTHAGVSEYEKFDYLEGRIPSSSVIPTCTNLANFKPGSSNRSCFTLGYLGSVGSWYLFENVADTVAILFKKDLNAKFLVVNRGGHKMITDTLASRNIDMSRVEIVEAAYGDVAAQIARMDAGIFFIKPAWSKRASCPTRMGEFLACGKPCIANAGVGDVKEDFHRTQTGVTLPVNTDGDIDFSGIEVALDDLLELCKEPDISSRCRELAVDRFALGAGVKELSSIYEKLAVQRRGE